MKEELYLWMKNLAVFYMMFTAVLHLVPDKKYERYVRSFMGLLLIYMLCTPVFVIFGKSRELMENFRVNFQQEQILLEEKGTENLQAFYLNQGFENELAEKIIESFADTGIKLEDTAVNIVGEKVSVTLYVPNDMTEEEEGRIYDALRQNFGIEKKDCQIVADGNDEAAVGSDPSSGASAGSNRGSGVGAGGTGNEEREHR